MGRVMYCAAHPNNPVDLSKALECAQTRHIRIAVCPNHGVYLGFQVRIPLTFELVYGKLPNGPKLANNPKRATVPNGLTGLCQWLTWKSVSV